MPGRISGRPSVHHTTAITRRRKRQSSWNTKLRGKKSLQKRCARRVRKGAILGGNHYLATRGMAKGGSYLRSQRSKKNLLSGEEEGCWTS